MKNNVKVTVKAEPNVSVVAARNSLPVHRINSINICPSATITACYFKYIYLTFHESCSGKPKI